MSLGIEPCVTQKCLAIDEDEYQIIFRIDKLGASLLLNLLMTLCTTQSTDGGEYKNLCVIIGISGSENGYQA